MQPEITDLLAELKKPPSERKLGIVKAALLLCLSADLRKALQQCSDDEAILYLLSRKLDLRLGALPDDLKVEFLAVLRAVLRGEAPEQKELLNRSPNENIFRREASKRRWYMKFRDKDAYLNKDIKGLDLIRVLIAHPGQFLSAEQLQLLSREEKALPLRNQFQCETEVLNVKDTLEYSPRSDRRNAKWLRNTIDEMREEKDSPMCDPQRRIEIEEKLPGLEKILKELNSKVDNHPNNLRLIVYRNIKRAFDSIAGVHEPLAEHLKAQIKTGFKCTYRDESESWETSPLP